ncbi:alpha/beta hydrolase family protein [Polychytrium aggregatum]|uniref:alpha/beta hydrolase family protein n=1 Tax=Polychytrium aggregatum TaxID=110093 RepID=UPI0022FF2AB9|nr:alpha/beta hydrolase family protein [Polychytrium aggregatum]KAI9203871.1 ovarian cancer-associated gene 2 protein [Polychytrium aggregatum]
MLRILCLHGYTQNASVLRKRTGVLRKDLKSLAELVYVSAPFEVAQAPSFNPQVFRPPPTEDEKQCTWWRANSEGTFYEGYEETIEYLKSFWQEHGPFDGILGFSQGAALVPLISYELLQAGLAPRFVVIFSGFRSRSTQHQQMLVEHSISIPSLHVIGKSDALIVPSRSEELSRVFHDPKVVFHEGGHFIPTDADQRAIYKEFIGQFATKSLL